jgi:tellurite resistance protein TehA-like permease
MNLADCEIDSFTFAWFSCKMSTGGIATLLGVQPNTFTGLQTIGKVVFIFDLVLFIAFSAAITYRFIVHHGTFSNAIRHPTESLFIPSFFPSIVGILNCARIYGVSATGYWLSYALRVCFWIYLASALLLAIAQYGYLFSAPPKRLTLHAMSPSWLLPIFPTTVCGTFASELATSEPAASATTILVAGFTVQGLGWMVTFLMYSVYIQRLLQYGLPSPDLRPGMFIPVGPTGFTGLALIGMSKLIPIYGYFEVNPSSVETLRTLALFFAM